MKLRQKTVGWINLPKIHFDNTDMIRFRNKRSEIEIIKTMELYLYRSSSIRVTR